MRRIGTDVEFRFHQPAIDLEVLLIALLREDTLPGADYLYDADIRLCGMIVRERANGLGRFPALA